MQPCENLRKELAEWILGGRFAAVSCILGCLRQCFCKTLAPNWSCTKKSRTTQKSYLLNPNHKPTLNPKNSALESLILSPGAGDSPLPSTQNVQDRPRPQKCRNPTSQKGPELHEWCPGSEEIGLRRTPLQPLWSKTPCSNIMQALIFGI